jgi:NADPH-dependent ferric siderophore reductase
MIVIFGMTRASQIDCQQNCQQMAVRESVRLIAEFAAVTFKGEKAREYAHWPRIEQEIRLLIPHEGLRSAEFSSDGIYFGFSDASLAARFDKAVRAGCCR